ncbi:hypothetical protein GCM10008938_38850 [Deinococcus roseus]|uniref:Aminoglycoside phosphotransferase domain-containing protein n=2 Tax=Deinococcus roseus TaxID=392414 RepID=A0ABQ2DAC0_9DEIO|nr:hypothetical protein GCM10008938_38850 [Deinococcus roseus]
MLLQHLRQVYGPEVEVLQTSTFTSGMAFPIHRLLVQHSGKTLPVVLKFYPAGFEGHFSRESWALTHLPELQIAAPMLLGTSQLPEGSAVVMEWIEGRPLMDLLLPEDHTLASKRFVDQLVKIHSVSIENLEISQENSESAFEGLCTIFENDFQKLHQPILTWTAQRLHKQTTFQKTLLHRDYHPWNVLAEPSGRLVVLDWDWGIGDPREDLGWTRLILQKSNLPLLAEEFTDLYCQQVPDARWNLEVFDVLAHLRWLQLLEKPSARSNMTPEIQQWIEKLQLETQQMIEQISGITIALHRKNPSDI